jgi:hypothetical protein
VLQYYTPFKLIYLPVKRTVSVKAFRFRNFRYKSPNSNYPQRSVNKGDLSIIVDLLNSHCCQLAERRGVRTIEDRQVCYCKNVHKQTFPLVSVAGGGLFFASIMQLICSCKTCYAADDCKYTRYCDSPDRSHPFQRLLRICTTSR